MKKNEKLLSILKGVINLIYGGLVIISILLVVVMAFSPLFLKENVRYLTASVPVSIGSSSTDPQFDVQVSGSTTKQISSAFVNETQGVLNLETTNWYFIFVSYMSKLVTAVVLAYAFYLLREVLAAIARDEIFTPENSQRLRRLGYAVLLLAFVRPGIEGMAASEILRQLSNVSPAISMPSPFKVEVLFASLLILILAQVWAYGLELKQEQDLTI